MPGELGRPAVPCGLCGGERRDLLGRAVEHRVRIDGKRARVCSGCYAKLQDVRGRASREGQRYRRADERRADLAIVPKSGRVSGQSLETTSGTIARSKRPTSWMSRKLAIEASAKRAAAHARIKAPTKKRATRRGGGR